MSVLDFMYVKNTRSKERNGTESLDPIDFRYEAEKASRSFL